MKKIVYLAFIPVLAIMLTLPGCESIQNLFGGKSKKIVIYTSMYENVVDSMGKTLAKEFPGYNIEFVYSGTGILEARIANEEISGRLGCDILMVADPAYSVELKEKDMLHSFNSKAIPNLAFEYDKEGYWYPVRVSNMVLAYNPARNAKNSVPNSFYDFAYDTKFRSAISMRNPLISGTTMATATALRDKYGYDYFSALGRQLVKIDYGSEDGLIKLEDGECAVIMALEESILMERQERRSRLEIIYPTDGIVIIPSPIMIINNKWSANRNSIVAEEIAEWFLSAEGQTAIIGGWMHTVRNDITRIPFGSVSMDEIRKNSIPVSWENVLRQKDEIKLRFEEYAIGLR